MTPATLTKLTKSIRAGELTKLEMDALISAINDRQSNTRAAVRATIGLGDSVKFTASKTGVTHTGKIVSVGPKFAKVSTVATMWRVPLTMLTLVKA